jgi:hypothetical protein
MFLGIDAELQQIHQPDSKSNALSSRKALRHLRDDASALRRGAGLVRRGPCAMSKRDGVSREIP